MSKISDEDAAQQFGIVTSHERLENVNDELRFRLVKSDGTAYIRTEASDKGGWQNSHYHEKIRETYIVQRGWIGYVETHDGKPVYSIYDAGQSVTTRPGIPHNIYLSGQAILHTVKHGESDGQDRLCNKEATRLDELTSGMSEFDLIKVSRRTTSKPSYSDAYRHFDNLIWQVPAWSTAIFALTFASIGSAEDISGALASFNLSKEQIVSSISGLMGGFLLVLSHALYRFRVHQSDQVDKSTGRSILFSPHFSLLAIVHIQGLVLLWLATPLFPISRTMGAIVLAILFVIITVYREREVNLHRNASSTSR